MILLDNSDADKNEQKKVLYDENPKTYKKDFIPAFEKLSNITTHKQLLKDLQVSIDYYKNMLGCQCDYNDTGGFNSMDETSHYATCQ